MTSPDAEKAHDGERCHACGRDYETVYNVPDDVWSAITPSETQTAGLLCLQCADDRARTEGIHLWWQAEVNDYPTAALAASRVRVEKLEELLQDARPLLGVSVRGSLGARADELLRESARD